MAEDPTLARAADIQQKFQFYLLALTFGVLAISIETASFDTPLVARGAELLGWVLLLLSGLVGLWRLESIPRLYQFIALDEHTQDRAHQLEMKKLGGEMVVYAIVEKNNIPIDQIIAQAESDRAKIKELLTPMGRRSDVKYKFQKITFVLGLVALMVSRGLARSAGSSRSSAVDS